MSEEAITAEDEVNEEQQEQERDDLDKAMEKTLNLSGLRRKEKRKAAKKLKRKQTRIEIALKAREEEEARSNDPEEQRRIMLKEQKEAEIMERQRKEFEERERVWIERAAKMAEEEERKMMFEDESRENEARSDDELNDDDAWDYIEEGPAEIIWQGNEIIVKKKSVRVPKRPVDQQFHDKDADRPTSNPLPPQSEAFASYKNRSSVSSQEVFGSVSQQTPNFGTEQDKAHCPFHIKTGACRFGSRCSRVHFYPDKSCTLLIKNMYNGPGIAWEQDEGLEKFISRLTLVEFQGLNFQFTDEEVERSYEEFYEDVHTEFLKFGEIVNFKVCKNGSFHLRGNVYVHYKSLESAILACHSINGRYFAGKLITCEYVGVTRWKVAICGEYMKSRLKTCSHGTACNFIHCFRNPGGDYEWADWDNPPPKYWVKKMAALFGPSDESTFEKCTARYSWVQPRNSSRKIMQNYDRYHSRRSRSRDVDYWDSSSGGDSSDENRKESVGRSSQQKHLGSSRKNELYIDESGKHKENLNFENDRYEGKSVTQDYDCGDSSGKDQDRCSSLSRTSFHRHKKREVFPDNDGNNYDNNGVEHDKYRGKEVRSHNSTCRHSKSKDGSSRRESLTRLTKEEKILNEHVASVESYETERTNGYDCRSKSNDLSSELNFRGNIDQCDRWEAVTTYSEENEKSGCSNFDNDEPYGGTHKCYDERYDTHSTKISSRCRSRSSHRTRSNSHDEDTDSSDFEGYHQDKRSHDHRRKSKRATSETFSSEGKSDYKNTRAHDSGEHQSSRRSRKHRSSNRRGKHDKEYEKVDNDENSQPKRTSGKRSRSRSPAQCSRRSKRERYGDQHES